MRSHTGKTIKLASSRPNVGIRQAYWRRLQSLIAEMHADVLATIRPIYYGDEGEITQDATPAVILQAAFRRLVRKWQARFDAGSNELAAYFATSSAQRTDGQLASILKRAGITVQFQLTPEIRDIVQASIAENVALIKSIQSQYFTQIEGDVMRSVSVGRDLGSLTQSLQKQYGVTQRRAAFIARDQNNKATAVITKARQVELGLKAIWMHSHGGRTPRPTHLANDGEPYDPVAGWYDPAVKERIWPGTLPNCRCFSRSVVPGLS